MIIVESWGIGIGKTELTKAVVDRLPGSRAFFEQAEGAPLDPFYSDVANGVKPSPAASRLQFWYMDTRYFAHLEAQRFEWVARRESIFDRSIWGDMGFAHKLWKDGFLSKLDYDIYRRHRDTMEAQLLPPHAVIRLETDPQFCIKRIVKRMADLGYRVCETAVTVEYLEGLRESYDEVVWPWFRKWNVPIITYPWDQGSWNTFPDLSIVLTDLKKVLPSFQPIEIEASTADLFLFK